MKWNVISGNWKQLRGNFKAKCGKLTADDRVTMKSQVYSTKLDVFKMSTTNTNSNIGDEKPGQAERRQASHPNTSASELDKLANSQHPGVAERVAKNANTDASTLARLSNHESFEVRAAVTENTNMSNDTRQLLVSDENAEVRYRMAENANTAVEDLRSLAHDDNPFVLALAQNTLDNLKSVSQRADEMLIQEQFVEAEDFYRKLIQGLEGLLGAEHKEVGLALYKLAAALVGQSKLDEAVTIGIRANIIIAEQKG
jgi:hypothetical protein